MAELYPTPRVSRLSALATSFVVLAVTGVAHAQLPISRSIVFVKQEPVDFTFATVADIFGNYQGYYPPEEQPVGGNLYRLDPDGTLTNLTGWSNAAVRDPEISYDGTTVLFSMKIGGFGRWQIWEVGVNGAGLRRVSTNDSHHDLDPAYLSDGRIVFTTDRQRWADGYENLPSAQIAVMESDGSGVEVLKRHMAGQFNPLLGSDGRLYFTQWDFHDRRASIASDNSDFDVNRFLLWQIFVDGSGLDHPTFGAHTLYDFSGGYVEVRELPSQPGSFVATLADEFATFGGGSLVRLTPQANQDLDQPVFLTPNVFMVEEGNSAGRWRSPYPLKDGRLAAAYSSGPVYDGASPPPHWRLVVLNGNGSGQQELYSDPAFWCLQPVEVRARTAPEIAAGRRNGQHRYAILNALDVTLRGRNGDEVLNGDDQPRVVDGQATEVRLYREDVRSSNYYEDFPNHADPDVTLLGTAAVRSDGSFAVAVPIDTPLTWELRNSSGQLIVRERFGTELKAGEFRQCGGCHTPHDGSTGRTTNLALETPTNLSGQNLDTNANGIVDLIESLDPELVFQDGFEAGNVGAWSASQ